MMTEGSGGKEFPLSIWMRQLNESQMGSEQQREGRLHEMSAPLIWPPRSPAAKTRSLAPPRVLKCWAVARCLYLLTTFGFKPSQVRSFLLPLSSPHTRTSYDFSPSSSFLAQNMTVKVTSTEFTTLSFSSPPLACTHCSCCCRCRCNRRV